MRSKPVLNVVPALAARTQLGQILRRVRHNKERFVVDRRGEPQAVIMSVEEYLRSFARTSGVLAKIRRAAKSNRLESMPLRTIDLEVKRHRRARHSRDD